MSECASTLHLYLYVSCQLVELFLVLAKYLQPVICFKSPLQFYFLSSYVLLVQSASLWGFVKNIANRQCLSKE